MPGRIPDGIRMAEEVHERMPLNQGKEWTFNTVADSYEKIRPGYPDELYQALFAYAPMDASGSALEIATPSMDSSSTLDRPCTRA